MNLHILPPYSVLMSVYYKEKPEFLKDAMESMRRQTVKTDDFVLICDGPLTKELDAVIDDEQILMTDTLHVIRLPENCGLGHALNEGIKHCRNDIVARMDSDDISHPDRCEKELAVLATSDASIVSATVEEFEISLDVVIAMRILPECHEEILAFSKTRNPFNHPCVMYKKSVIEEVGGYQDIYLLEDYHLWLRILMNGNKGYNIREPLLWMRAGSDMYKRRAGWKYAMAQMQLFKFMKEKKYIGAVDYYKAIVIRTCSSCAPNWLRKTMFMKLLRNR